MNMFTIYSLFYSVLLNIVYFARKRLVTFENKIFEKLMITNLEKIRDLLLPKLMSGEIDVSKVNY